MIFKFNYFKAYFDKESITVKDLAKILMKYL